MRHLNHGGETPNKALNKIVNKEEITTPLGKSKQKSKWTRFKVKVQSMKANQNMTKLL